MRLSLLLCAAIVVSAQPAEEKKPEAPKSAVRWQKGPMKGKLGALAEVDVPEGYAFADAHNTRTFLKETGNLTDGSEQGTIIKIKDDWFVVFEFEDSGYVKDDEKANLDADGLLGQLRENNTAGNERRKEMGLPELKLVGWFEKPHYDAATHNLVWATILESGGGRSVNHNMKLLGRRGVMSATLVADPNQMAAAVKDYNGLITKYEYTADNKYSAFREGDKIAEYGLSALVLGGAAAAAAKTGLLKTIGKFLIAGWKLVAVGLIAVGAAIKRLFSGKPKAEEATVDPTPSAE